MEKRKNSIEGGEGSKKTKYKGPQKGLL